MAFGRPSRAGCLAALIAIVLAATASLWHHHDHGAQKDLEPDQSCVVCVAAVQPGPNLTDVGPTLFLRLEQTGLAGIRARVAIPLLRVEAPRSRGPPAA